MENGDAATPLGAFHQLRRLDSSHTDRPMSESVTPMQVRKKTKYSVILQSRR
jgi:hypothetical protein